MTFKEAQAKLKEMANGDYHAIEYKIVVQHTGEQKEECSVYINDQDYHKHCTWEGAIESMERAISGETVRGEQEPKEDVSEPMGVAKENA